MPSTPARPARPTHLDPPSGPAPTRRDLHRSLAAAALAGLLHGCGGGAGGRDASPAPAPRLLAEGLDGRVVLRLRPSAGGGLLAATDDGLYQRLPGGAWTTRGLRGEHVHDVAAVSASRWLASVRSAAGGVDAPPRLLETTNAGVDWHLVVHDFGGAAGVEPIQALVHDGAGARLLATGADVLAVSRDLGRSWQRVAGEYHAFTSPKTALSFDPQLGDVWFGGQDAIERLALFRWRQADGAVVAHPDLMAAPSVVKGIRFDQGRPGRVLVAGEGGVVHSVDRGARWERLFADDHHFYFDVVQDPQRPQRWLTARWEKNFDHPQRLHVKVSDDEGRHWSGLTHGDERLYGGVWSLAVSVEDGRTQFHLGLYKGGVMRLELP